MSFFLLRTDGIYLYSFAFGVEKTHVAGVPTYVDSFALFYLLDYVLGKNFGEMVPPHIDTAAFKYFYNPFLPPLHAVDPNPSPPIPKLHHTDLLTVLQPHLLISIPIDTNISIVSTDSRMPTADKNR